MAREFSKSFYKSKEWQQCREYCLKRDNYLCKHCGHPAQEVHHVIHLSPENIGDLSVCLNPDNLICLCRDCHFEEHRADQAQGRTKNKMDDYEYVFDENGLLVRKSPHQK